MSNEREISRKAEETLEKIRKKVDELAYLEKQLRNSLQEYYETRSSSEGFRAEMQLNAWVEYSVSSGASIISPLRQQGLESEENLVISLDQSWKAYEFKTLFKYDLKLLKVVNEIEQEKINSKKIELLEEKGKALEAVKKSAEQIAELDKSKVAKGEILENRFIGTMDSLINYSSRDKIGINPTDIARDS